MIKSDLLAKEIGQLAVFFANQCDGVTGIQKETEGETKVKKTFEYLN